MLGSEDHFSSTGTQIYRCPVETDCFVVGPFTLDSHHTSFYFLPSTLPLTDGLFSYTGSLFVIDYTTEIRTFLMLHSFSPVKTSTLHHRKYYCRPVTPIYPKVTRLAPFTGEIHFEKEVERTLLKSSYIQRLFTDHTDYRYICIEFHGSR